MAAIQRTEANFTRLLRSVHDGTRRVKRLSWTIRDLAAHLVSGSVAYRQVAEGDPSPYEALERRAETNQKRLEAESSQDLEAMADRIDAEVSKMLAALASRRDDDVVSWHGDRSLPLPGFLGAAVGEFMIHGRDLARTVGHRWPIDRRDALPGRRFLQRSDALRGG